MRSRVMSNCWRRDKPSCLKPAGASDAGTPAQVRSRPSRGLLASQPPSSEADVLDLGRADSDLGQRAAGPVTALSVVVLNGDLKFVQQALLVGHYRSITLTGWLVRTLPRWMRPTPIRPTKLL